MNQTNENSSGGAGPAVRTWRARMGVSADFPLSMPSSVERAMEEEIAELRAEPTVDRRRIINPLDTPEFRECLDAYTRAMAKASLFDPASVNASFETRKTLIDFIEAWAGKVAAPVEQGQGTAPEGQPLIGKLLDDFSELPVLWGLGEPGALVRHGDVFKLIVAAGKSIA